MSGATRSVVMTARVMTAQEMASGRFWGPIWAQQKATVSLAEAEGKSSSSMAVRVLRRKSGQEEKGGATGAAELGAMRRRGAGRDGPRCTMVATNRDCADHGGDNGT